MRDKLLLSLFVVIFTTTVHSSEFQVNVRTSYSQANPDIAAEPNGGFIAVWSDYYALDGQSNDICCRFFEPNCSPVGDELKINKSIPGNQTEPAIAVKKTGEFIVIWQGPGIEGEDVFAQWLDVNGVQVGDEFKVNSYDLNDQVHPKIAMNDSGSHVIVWESESPEDEPETTMVFGHLYDANGAALGDEFQVNTTPDCKYPDVEIDPNGGFVVTWMQGKRPNFSIMARLYDCNGLSITEPFKVSTIKISSFAQPAIAMDAAGCFVVTWDGDPNKASFDDINARIFEPNGAPVGEQFIVNTTLENEQQNPQIAMNDSGEFIIVWDNQVDPNVKEKDIYGQRFNADGKPLGDEFCLNSYTDSVQKNPTVAIINNGRFIVLWQSQNQDASEYGIYGNSGKMVAAADFNLDGYIDFYDYHILASEWKKFIAADVNDPNEEFEEITEPGQEHGEKILITDLIEDNKIDSNDLLAFCKNWLRPYE